MYMDALIDILGHMSIATQWLHDNKNRPIHVFNLT
jgi:hypothetical protein